MTKKSFGRRVRIARGRDAPVVRQKVQSAMFGDLTEDSVTATLDHYRSQLVPTFVRSELDRAWRNHYRRAPHVKIR